MHLTGWNVQADPGVQRGVSQQAAGGEVPVQDVPPQHLRGRRHLPRHSPEQMEPHLRRLRHPHQYPVTGRGPGYLNFIRKLFDAFPP